MKSQASVGAWCFNEVFNDMLFKAIVDVIEAKFSELGSYITCLIISNKLENVGVIDKLVLCPFVKALGFMKFQLEACFNEMI